MALLGAIFLGANAPRKADGNGAKYQKWKKTILGLGMGDAENVKSAGKK